MKDIKIKDIGSKTIKSLDKTITGLKNTKDNLVDVKNNIDNITIKEESINQGASDKIITSSNYIKGTTITTILINIPNPKTILHYLFFYDLS